MIEYIKGKIDELTPTSVTLEAANGVAYVLNITLPGYSALQSLEQAKVYVHEIIREDAWTLYGFVDKRERELFRALIGVSGVGASSASIILSSISLPELEVAIQSGDDKRLTSVKGIGKKTAQRIIVDLQGKIKSSDDALIEMSLPIGQTFDEALSALLTLGFQRQASQKALKSLFDANPSMKVDEAIRKALSML